MEKIQTIIEWLNCSDSPVELRTNESYSLPFLKSFKEKNNIIIFSFRGRKNKGIGEVKNSPPEIINIFQIKLDGTREIQELDSWDVDLRNNIDILPDVIENINVDYANLYSDIVKITDDIISGSLDKKNFSRYAFLFRIYNSDRFRSVYYSLGEEFFKYIASNIT